MSTLIPTVSDDGRPKAAEAPVAADSAATEALDPRALATLQAGGISLAETLSVALSSLTANKLRTLLTALASSSAWRRSWR